MERRGHLTAELCLSDAKKETIYKCMNITFELRLGKGDLKKRASVLSSSCIMISCDCMLIVFYGGINFSKQKKIKNYVTSLSHETLSSSIEESVGENYNQLNTINLAFLRRCQASWCLIAGPM